MKNKNLLTLKGSSLSLDQILFGTLLGDAFAQRVHKNGGVRIRFGQNGENHKDYIYFLKEIFKDFVSSEVHVYKKKNKNYLKAYTQYSFQSLMFPCFESYRTMFYKKDLDGKAIKVVPSNEELDKYLSPVALAYWFMDDGAKASAKSKGYVFCTHNFSYNDVVRLSVFINGKYNLESVVRKDRNYFVIYVQSKDSERFISLIKPYVHVSMLYKLL